jgi:hypothetical protein
MAEQPLQGQGGDGWPGPDDAGDDTIEGQVLTFPRPAAPPAAAPRMAGPGQRGELRRIIPEHLATLAGIR